MPLERHDPATHAAEVHFRIPNQRTRRHQTKEPGAGWRQETPPGANPSIKSRDVLSSVIGSAVKYGFLCDQPGKKRCNYRHRNAGRRRHKPFVRSEQFSALVELIQEPYATMVYVAVYTGLRVSQRSDCAAVERYPQNSRSPSTSGIAGETGRPRRATLPTRPFRSTGRSSSGFSVCGR